MWGLLQSLFRLMVTTFLTVFSSSEPLGSYVSFKYSQASVVRPSSTFPKIFSETTGAIEAIFHMEPKWVRRTKVCSRDMGHMTKMAA